MAALRLELRASRTLAAVLGIVHAGAAAALVLAVPGMTGAAIAALLVGLGAAVIRDRALLRGARALRVIEVSGEGALTAWLASGERRAGAAGGRCHVGPWWVVAPLQGARGRALVVRDMLTREEFRRLRLWALWGRVPRPMRATTAP